MQWSCDIACVYSVWQTCPAAADLNYDLVALASNIPRSAWHALFGLQRPVHELSYFLHHLHWIVTFFKELCQAVINRHRWRRPQAVHTHACRKFHVTREVSLLPYLLWCVICLCLGEAIVGFGIVCDCNAAGIAHFPRASGLPSKSQYCTSAHTRTQGYCGMSCRQAQK